LDGFGNFSDVASNLDPFGLVALAEQTVRTGARVATLTIGTKRYTELKDTVVQMPVARLPETLAETKDYAAKTFDVENLIAEKMNKIGPEQYESILRPVFKDDEMLMVSVGAVLGFFVGELQVFCRPHPTARGCR
jgi:uncharacterized membrane protein YheB (UPF0754 family)